ncbi:Response regulator receiver modulated CheW protein [Pseudodesulfovibrio profundus]|uniref:Response regulator receiver modulated CheW protein n=1 Tax=Pseudodesulfovibrio profundus TaxID=57320 RepID=A0A2C8FEL4_9BACT|nr:chemotaxis protein [Pseudodesulfovibrio profundus]MBC16401.1 chemotaxis protein CheV [Desulfovibrio sp.]SOB60866.1 Response regulator receiver modulated CheW protein [Pseudodesulfovibrio profundus]|tara:strand:- start:10114 stop:11136 length:1023 start_codon:yes stop_codon:yes gene_type:complete
MAQSSTEILLEAGTNELEIVEFYLEEEPKADEDGELNEEVTDPSSSKDGQRKPSRKSYYGINVAKVLEIIRMPEVTEMPEVSHQSVLGAFNLRSRIIPLLDLSIWLKKKRVQNEPPKVIVTEFNQVTSAFMVSGVTRIHRISWEDVEAPNKYVSALSSDSITGVVKLDDRIVFILDLERIVSELNPQMRLKLDDDFQLEGASGYKALIADDSPLIREMIHDMLGQAGFRVEKTNNGRECWDRLQELKENAAQDGRPITDYVQVIVSDIEMPMMDGHHLCKRIKEDPVLRNLPVILFSSLITEKLRHRGETVGADDQISKPEITQLAQRSASLIEQRKKTS